MLKESFIHGLGDLYRCRTVDYFRFNFDILSNYFTNKFIDLDNDNANSCYDTINGIIYTFQRVDGPRGRALITYSVYSDRAVPMFFYEEYNPDTAKLTGHLCRLDFYSSFFRFFYMKNESPRSILSSIIPPLLSIFFPLSPYVITRYDIAIDLKIPFTDPMIKDFDTIFTLRSDTRKNIEPYPNSYYVGSRESKYRFYRVYNKTKDIKKNHKEFLFPELLDGDFTRIEAQYNSGCSFDSINEFLNIHFPIIPYDNSKDPDIFFLSYKVPDSVNSLSVDDRMNKLIASAIKQGLTEKQIRLAFYNSINNHFIGI